MTMILMTVAQSTLVEMVEHVLIGTMVTSALAGQSLLDSSARHQPTSAKSIHAITTEPVFRAWVHFPAAATWVSPGRNVRQRSMNASQTLVLMEQLAWIVSMAILVPVLWAILVVRVKQESIIV